MALCAHRRALTLALFGVLVVAGYPGSGLVLVLVGVAMLLLGGGQLLLYR